MTFTRMRHGAVPNFPETFTHFAVMKSRLICQLRANFSIEPVSPHDNDQAKVNISTRENTVQRLDKILTTLNDCQMMELSFEAINFTKCKKIRQLQNPAQFLIS